MKGKELIKRIKLPARASIYYLTASAVGKVVSFVITPFATRLLSKEDFGQFNLYMAILGTVSIVCSALTSGSPIYKGIKEHNDCRTGYLKGVLGINFVFSLLICILLLTLMPFLKLKRFLLIPMTIQILCDGIIAVSMSMKRFDYKYKSVASVAVISSVLPPVMAILILKKWGGGYVVRIYALLFVSLCLAAYSLSIILRGNDKPRAETLKYILRTSTPLLPHSISGALYGQADKLFITALMGSVALAKYSVVYSLGIALQFTVTAIGSALTPWIIRRLDAGEENKIAELILPMTIGYCALSLCLIAVAPEAMMILAPSDYMDALPAILPLAFSTPLSFIGSTATVGLSYYNRSKYMLAVSFIGTSVCVILNYMLIGRFGFIGAGGAMLLSQGVTTLISVIFLKKAKLGRMLNNTKILLPFLISSAVGVVVFMLKESLTFRAFSLILPFGMLIYCLKSAGELILEKGRKATA